MSFELRVPPTLFAPATRMAALGLLRRWHGGDPPRVLCAAAYVDNLYVVGPTSGSATNRLDDCATYLHRRWSLASKYARARPAWRRSPGLVYGADHERARVCRGFR